MQVLRLLLDAGCPLTKARLTPDYRWQPVLQGESLLESVAASCCQKKGSLLLERVMAAR